MKGIFRYSFLILLLISVIGYGGLQFAQANQVETIPPAQIQPIVETEPVTEPETLPPEPSTEAVTVPETELETEPETEPETIPEPTAGFAEVGNDYFDDVLFIGDSRTVGLRAYGDFPDAHYFCSTSMSVIGVLSAYEYVRDYGETSLSYLLDRASFGKVYIMLGINELPGIWDDNLAAFSTLLQMIREKQPNALIVIQANMHVDGKRSRYDTIYNNDNINNYNQKLSEFTDGKQIFYIDMNESFDDENGNLGEGYSNDGTHLLAKHYAQWSQYLRENAVVFQ